MEAEKMSGYCRCDIFIPQSCRVVIDQKILQTEEEKATKVSYLRLLKMVKGEWYYIALGVAASAVLGCVMPLFAVILSDVISRLDPMIRENGVLKKQRYSKVVEVAVGFFGLGFGMLLFAFIQGVCFAIVGARLAERVRRLFFKAVLSMEIAWFDRDENTSGALASRLSADAPRVRGAVADTMGILVQNATTIIVAYIIAFVNDWRMTLVITAVIPLLIFASIMQMKFFTGACLFELLP
jgi:ABC-type multidrug transport system fused ATPase/permease subunit